MGLGDIISTDHIATFYVLSTAKKDIIRRHTSVLFTENAAKSSIPHSHIFTTVYFTDLYHFSGFYVTHICTLPYSKNNIC